ncbi:hypothetical protein CYG48_08970 [Neorhizobium sp. SOG26]|uniref:hypothetical protein n=1 Tax=Neorhizobium sp. SOG26 TaxID=2060726 RepID=UPI000E57A05E|nr:hypothetical protein [Neorhizobium sp. SOG26]AXV15816.1 hypothetical protein CYG48_08970 [Neorhizobium sp. SOG26]
MILVAAVHDAIQAENLLKASIDALEVLHKQLSGSDAASATRIRKGLRIALDRVGDVLDQLDPNGTVPRGK